MSASHAYEDEPWTFSALFSVFSDTLLSLLLLLSSVVSCFTSQMAALLDLHLGHEDHWQLPNSSFGGRSFAPASSRLFKEEQAMQGGGGACSVCSFRNPVTKTELEHFCRPPWRKEKSSPREEEEEEEEEEETAWKKMGPEKVNREKSIPPPAPISQPCHTEDWDSESSVDSVMHRLTRKVDHKESAPIPAPVGRSSHTRYRDSQSSVDSDKHRSTRKVDHKKPAPIPVPVGRSSHTRDQDSESSVDSDERQSTRKVDRRNTALIPVSQREDRGGSKFSVDSDKHLLTWKVDRKNSASIPVSGDRSSHLEEPDFESLVDSGKRQSTRKADCRKSIPIPVSVDRSSQREEWHSKLTTDSDKHPLTRKVDCKKSVSVPVSVDRPPRTEEQDSEFCMDSGKNPLTRRVDRKKSASTVVFIDRSYQMEDGRDSKLSTDSNKHPPPQNETRQKPTPISVSVDWDSEFSVDSDKHLSLAWNKKSTSIPVSVDQSSQTENRDSKFSMDSDKHHLSSRKAGCKKSAASIPVFVDCSSQTEDRDYSDKHQPSLKGGCQKSTSVPVSVDHIAQMEDRDKHPSPQKSDPEKSTSNPLSADRGNMKAVPIAVLVDRSTQVEHHPVSRFSMDSDKHPPAQNRKPISVPVLVDQGHSKTAAIPASIDRSTQLEDRDSKECLPTQEVGCEKATSTPVSVDRSTQEDDWNEQWRGVGTLTDSVAASEELLGERKEMGSVHLSGEREEEAVAAMEDNNVFLGNNLHAGPGESKQEPALLSDESKPGVEEDPAAEGKGEGDGDTYYLQDIGYIRGLEDLRKAVRDEKKQKTELYAELERERQAAAIAAMETMAMITRLQEEKSAMRLEVSQLHRVAEEKSEHDDQSMATLTEILLKRETENHALEKEVELFRERLLQREEENGKVLLLKGPDGYGTTEDEKDLPRSVPSQSNHGEEQAMESLVGPLFSDGKEETEFLLEQLWMLEDEISNLKKKTERKKKKRTKMREDSNPSRQFRTEAERRVSYGPSDSTVADTARVGNESEFSELLSNEAKIRQGGGIHEVPHLGLKHRRSSRPEWSENESSDDGGDEHGKLEIRGDGHNKLDGRSGRRMRKMRRTVSDPQGMITHFDDWSDASDSDHRSKSMLRQNTKWMITDEEGRRSSQHKARVPLQYLD